MHRSGELLDLALLSHELIRKRHGEVRQIIYVLPFVSPPISAFLCRNDTKHNIYQRRLGNYVGSTKHPDDREDQHKRKPANQLVARAREQVGRPPSMETVHEMTPGAPFFASYGMEGSVIGCSGSAKRQARGDNPGPFLQFNTFDAPVNDLAGSMPLRLRRPAALRFYVLARYFSDHGMRILPPKGFRPEHGQHRFVVEAWKAICGPDYPGWEDEQASYISVRLRGSIKDASKRLGPLDHSKYHLGDWHGSRKMNHLRNPLVQQLALASATPVPDNYKGQHKFGLRAVDDAVPINKEHWKEFAYALHPSVSSPEPHTNNVQPVESSEPGTSNADRETTGQELQAPSSSELGDAESQGYQAEINVAIDERRWRDRTIQKGATAFHLENFDNVASQTVVKIKSIGKWPGLLEWLNHWIKPSANFTIEEIVAALADQDETFTTNYDPAYPNRKGGFNLVANPAMQTRMLKSRRRAARALAKLDGVHAPDAFLMAFADPITNYYRHWAFVGLESNLLINFMFEFSPGAADPEVDEMGIVLQNILEKQLGFHQLEARAIVQSPKCTGILRCLLSPHFKHVYAFDKLIKKLRKSSKIYPKLTARDEQAL